MKITGRKCTGVVQVHFELEYHVYERIEAYCKETQMSKRKLLQDAVTVWLNQRAMEAKGVK
jgi:hypothetical protein